MRKPFQPIIPPVIISTAENVRYETSLIARVRETAIHEYKDPIYLARVRATRGQPVFSDLRLDAQDVVAWALALRKKLPANMLASRFRSVSPSVPVPSISVIRHEIVLNDSNGIGGAVLTTELALVLDAKEGLFQHYEWYDKFLVVRGAPLNSDQELCETLHPAMLKYIHSALTQGDNWHYVDDSLKELISIFKDR